MKEKILSIHGVLSIALLAAGLGYFLFGAEWSSSRTLEPNQILLRAGDNNGHDPVWKKRHYYGLATWGIRGSGKVESGKIWFDGFPGDSGYYDITMGALFERDGRGAYRVVAGERTLQEGEFPYYQGTKDCNSRGGQGNLSLGRHWIEKGEKITVWGESIYECGEKGAYTLWYELLFTRTDHGG